MNLLELLSMKGYLFHSDEPGFFLRCADTTLQYQTWDSNIRPTRIETKAPFGLIYAKKNTAQRSEILYNQLRKNWQDFSYHPETLILCTSKCNLNCSYCIIGVQEGEQYSFPSIEQIESAFKSFAVKRVEITGGEPLAERDNLEKILEWLIGKVERCDLVTNGLALDDAIWPLLLKCGKNLDLRMRLTLSEGLSHMTLNEFETKILPQAVNNPKVKINLNFLPNNDGSGMAGFFKRINQLQLPPHITVAPICLLESKFSGPVAFNMEEFIKEMIEVIENEDENLCNVNFFPEHDFGLMVHSPQLLGCRRGKIALSDKGYGLCHMFLREGKCLSGPLETTLSSWEAFTNQCRDCEYYPDNCLEAFISDSCFYVKPGCHRCPIIYNCLLRCPYVFNVKKDIDVGNIDLQCMGHALLRVFSIWLLQRKRSWEDIRGEIITAHD